MLDTSILIYFIKNKPQSVAEQINRLSVNDELCMSFVTYSELLKGAEISSKREVVLERLQSLTTVVPVRLALSQSICQIYASLFTQLKRQGTPIGGNDLWIACHALSENASLVTNNTREFERVDGLRLENWAVSRNL